MDGIYFEQGANAAKDATSWADMGRLNPYTLHGSEMERHRHRIWNNGFVYKFDPSKVSPAVITAQALAKHTLSGRLAVAP